MKAKLTFGILLVIATLGIRESFGQATAYANIYANVVAPVGLSNSSEINMGAIEVSQTNSAFTNTAKTEITASGYKIAQDGTALLASFSVTDFNKSTFDVTLPSEEMIIGDNSNNAMIISAFSSTNSITGTAKAAKNQITIAASIKVNESQMIGNYSTTNPFPVTLNFN